MCVAMMACTGHLWLRTGALQAKTTITEWLDLPSSFDLHCPVVRLFPPNQPLPTYAGSDLTQHGASENTQDFSSVTVGKASGAQVTGIIWYPKDVRAALGAAVHGCVSEAHGSEVLSSS